MRRAKLYYLRGRRGKSARIAEDTSYRREQEATVAEAVKSDMEEKSDQNTDADRATELQELSEEKTEKE